jgi:carbonic anhydrase/acetyltransferase-like protein (isoleucine patch superfamily)
MIRRNPNGDLPVIDESAYVDQTAIVCGKVIVGANVFIGPYAVIRADETRDDGSMEPIIIGANSNIQDGVVIHSRAGGRVTIGEHTSIAHRSIIHGPCAVGDRVFIGFNSVLFNCTVEEQAVVRHNSVVEGCRVPPRFHIPSTTAIRSDADLEGIEQVTPDFTSFSEDVARANISLVQGYRRLRNEF